MSSYRKLCRLIQDSCNVGLSAKGPLFELDHAITDAGLLGLGRFQANSLSLQRAGPIRIATGAAAFASLAVLKHLNQLYQCAVELDFEHINTRTLIREIGSWRGDHDPPDGVVVSVSACGDVFTLVSATRVSACDDITW
jgi:hypothetical protein